LNEKLKLGRGSSLRFKKQTDSFPFFKTEIPGIEDFQMFVFYLMQYLQRQSED